MAKKSHLLATQLEKPENVPVWHYPNWVIQPLQKVRLSDQDDIHLVWIRFPSYSYLLAHSHQAMANNHIWLAVLGQDINCVHSTIPNRQKKNINTGNSRWGDMVTAHTQENYIFGIQGKVWAPWKVSFSPWKSIFGSLFLPWLFASSLLWPGFTERPSPDSRATTKARIINLFTLAQRIGW